MFEVFLQMHKSAGCLDQSFEKIIIGRVFIQPDLFEDIVRFIILLIAPALEVGAIKWVVDHLAGSWICIAPNQLAYES